MVGFGTNFPKQPHHKAAACRSPPAECSWSTFQDLSQDNPHQLDGALVGGPKYANDQYQDIRTDYIMNEVTLDYNAGFQSAVAGLKAKACGSSTGGPSSSQTSSSTEANTETTTNGGSETSVTSSGTEQTTAITSQGCNSLITITNSWEGNVQGKLKIVVPTDISSFTIGLETDISLTNINFFTAIASPSSGNQFSLTSYDWFSGLAAGQTLELEYQMTFSGPDQPNIVKLTLNEVDACSSAGHSTSPNPASTTSSSVSSTTNSNPESTSTTSNSVSSTTSSSNPESTTSSSTSCSAERYDYGEVLRLSNLFYEAQRSGDLPVNNRVPWRGDSSTDDKGINGEDLSGGYHDGKNISIRWPQHIN